MATRLPADLLRIVHSFSSDRVGCHPVAKLLHALSFRRSPGGLNVQCCFLEGYFRRRLWRCPHFHDCPVCHMRDHYCMAANQWSVTKSKEFRISYNHPALSWSTALRCVHGGGCPFSHVARGLGESWETLGGSASAHHLSRSREPRQRALGPSSAIPL